MVDENQKETVEAKDSSSDEEVRPSYLTKEDLLVELQRVERTSQSAKDKRFAQMERELKELRQQAGQAHSYSQFLLEQQMNTMSPEEKTMMEFRMWNQEREQAKKVQREPVESSDDIIERVKSDLGEWLTESFPDVNLDDSTIDWSSVAKEPTVTKALRKLKGYAQQIEAAKNPPEPKSPAKPAKRTTAPSSEASTGAGPKSAWGGKFDLTKYRALPFKERQALAHELQKAVAEGRVVEGEAE